MTPLLTPKNDYVFKLLMGRNPEILADLINCILTLPDNKRIQSVEVRNPEIRSEDITGKFIILDIHAVDGNGREYDIEMQVRKYESYPQRTIYYACRLYSDQLKTGEDYSELKPVFGIHFLDYEFFPEHPEFHFRFTFTDARYPKLELSDDISIHIFELPKAENAAPDEKAAALLEWLRFFNHAHEKGSDEMRQEFTNPMIHRAVGKLENLSADRETRTRAAAREKALKDEITLLREAERRGEKRGEQRGIKKGEMREKLAIVRSLLFMGDLPIHKISRATGFDIDEIEKLKEKLTSDTEH